MTFIFIDLVGFIFVCWYEMSGTFRLFNISCLDWFEQIVIWCWRLANFWLIYLVWEHEILTVCLVMLPRSFKPIFHLLLWFSAAVFIKLWRFWVRRLFMGGPYLKYQLKQQWRSLFCLTLLVFTKKAVQYKHHILLE